MDTPQALPKNAVVTDRAGTFEQKRHDCRWMPWTGRVMMAACIVFWCAAAGLYAGIRNGAKVEAAAEWVIGQVSHRPEACRHLFGAECIASMDDQ